jgi:hypothetical protein
MNKKNDNITESWLCVDCGVNTAPGIPDGPTTRVQLTLMGKSNSTITRFSELYMVRDVIWAKAGMTDFGGCLCVGCLEKRLGRKLKPKDFQPDHPFNQPDFPRSQRLEDRLRGRGYFVALPLTKEERR